MQLRENEEEKACAKLYVRKQSRAKYLEKYEKHLNLLTMKTLGLVTTTEEGIFNLLTVGFGGGGGGSGAPISASRTCNFNASSISRTKM